MVYSCTLASTHPPTLLWLRRGSEMFEEDHLSHLVTGWRLRGRRHPRHPHVTRHGDVDTQQRERGASEGGDILFSLFRFIQIHILRIILL